MPPALTRVEEAANLLVVACEMLKQDPYSSPARKKLIEGARGKVHGDKILVSDLLSWLSWYKIIICE